MNIEIVSLMEVVEKVNWQTDEHYISLNRLADLDGGYILPVDYDNTKPRVFSNRDNVYKNDGPDEVGYIGVWRWAFEKHKDDGTKDYITKSVYDPYSRPTIIMHMRDSFSLEKIASSLKGNGVKWIYPEPMDAFFCVTEGRNYFKGLLFRANQMNLEEGHIVVKEEETVAEVHTIPRDSVLVFSTPNAEHEIYNQIQFPKASELKIIVPYEELIYRELRERSSWKKFKNLFQGTTKEEHSRWKQFIESFSDQDFLSQVAAKYSVSKDVVKNWFNLYMNNVQDFIDGEDIETQIVRKVFRVDSELRATWSKEIEADWKKQNDELVKAYEQQIGKQTEENKKLKSEFTELEAEAKNKKDESFRLDAEIAGKKEEIKELDRQIAEKDTLVSRIADSMQSKLEQAKADVASFVSDISIYLPALTQNTIGNTEKIYEGFYISGAYENPDDVEEISSLDELSCLLEENLRTADIADIYVEHLCEALIAGYVTSTNFIIAGPAARNIADAFSASIIGRKIDRFVCSGEFKASELEMALSEVDSPLLIENAFDDRWFFNICNMAHGSKRMLILTCSSVDEITLESSVIQDYFILIQTDYMMRLGYANEENELLYSRYQSASEFALPKLVLTKNAKSIGKAIGLRRLGLGRIQKLVFFMNEYFASNAERDFMLFYLPVANLLGASDTVAEFLDKDVYIKLADRDKLIVNEVLGLDI